MQTGGEISRAQSSRPNGPGIKKAKIILRPFLKSVSDVAHILFIYDFNATFVSMELQQPIQSKIYEIRGQRVMLDFDLAELYQVETRALKQAVRRNIERFPEDFMFEITEPEYNYLKNSLTSQIVISNERGGRRYMPFAFTEQGVAMLSSVLRSRTAIQANIAIMRAFVAMRNYITTTTTVTAELSEIRARLALLERADEDNAEAVNDLSEDMRKELDNIYEAIAALSVRIPEVKKPREPIGFKKNG